MTTSTFSAAPTNATDAEFRDWGSKLSDALAAVGMVKTADTGQIDWATVVKPAAISTYQGYEVWRFNDTLQATAPLFLKIEYGSGVSVATRPGLRLQVGKGTNGAGTLTGAFGGGATAHNATNFSVEGGGAAGWYSWVYSSAAMFQGVAAATPLPTSAPSTTSGGVAPMYPILCMDGQGHYWQSRALLQYNANDAALAVPVSVAGWGTYLPVWAVFTTTGTNAAVAWY
jgi:hypothetical protein